MAVKLKRVMHGVEGDKPPTIGKDVEILKFGLHRYGTLGPAGQDFFPKPAAGFGPVYDDKTRRAVFVLQELEIGAGNPEIDKATGKTDRPTWETVWEYLDAYRRQKYRLFIPPKPKPPMPKLGPIQPGGQSLLDMSLTHDTSDIDLFPAVDTAWGGGGGVTVIAPEDCVVDTKDTSSTPGEAVYLTGVSKMRHWIGHLDRDWPLGHRFKKGDVIGKTLPIPGRSDHAHWGVNAEALLGKGKELKWGSTGKGPRYSLGAPTIREQLKAALS